MLLKHNRIRKNLSASQLLWSSKPSRFALRTAVPALLLLFLTCILAGKVPALAVALNLIAAYVLVALLTMRIMPQLLGSARSWTWFGIASGVALFATIAAPADAAIFDTAEKYTTQIFGKYIDTSMITLIFGFLRISSFILGAAFVLLALEKARHGENWQPFAWNAFAVLMIVVLVEGMSTLFLSSTTATTAPAPTASP